MFLISTQGHNLNSFLVTFVILYNKSKLFLDVVLENWCFWHQTPKKHYFLSLKTNKWTRCQFISASLTSTQNHHTTPDNALVINHWIISCNSENMLFILVELREYCRKRKKDRRDREKQTGESVAVDLG